MLSSQHSRGVPLCELHLYEMKDNIVTLMPGILESSWCFQQGILGLW